MQSERAGQIWWQRSTPNSAQDPFRDWTMQMGIQRMWGWTYNETPATILYPWRSESVQPPSQILPPALDESRVVTREEEDPMWEVREKWQEPILTLASSSSSSSLYWQNPTQVSRQGSVWLVNEFCTLITMTWVCISETTSLCKAIVLIKLVWK